MGNQIHKMKDYIIFTKDAELLKRVVTQLLRAKVEMLLQEGAVVFSCNPAFMSRFLLGMKVNEMFTVQRIK